VGPYEEGLGRVGIQGTNGAKAKGQMAAHAGSSAVRLRAGAVAIVRRLQAEGFKAYWVGGCVRDVLLGRSPGDFDIATSAVPSEIERIFPVVIPVGRAFGVMLVRQADDEFEVATFRAESDYTDGRHPSRVSFGDATADALRRDFTINGLFYDPVKEKLHDWVGGEADLGARLVRTIGVPEERFQEDHLRLLRAVRLAAQLNFEIEAGTFEALRKLAQSLRGISAERIRDELKRVFRPPHAARGLDLLRDSGLLAVVLPELAATITCEQSPDFHPEGTVYQHIRLMLSKMSESADEMLPWAVLLHDVAKPVTATTDDRTGSIHFYTHEKVGAEMAEAILERLKFPRKDIEAVVQAVRCHMQFKDTLEMRKSTIRRILMRPTFPLELELHYLDCVSSHGRLDAYAHLLEEARELERKPEILPPLISGTDLISLGMRPGPAIGALLEEIREKQLQEELKTSQEALEWAKSRIGG